MANLTETGAWAAGVFQLELATPVRGGASGESNVPLLNLANRTAYLRSHVDAIEAALPALAPKASPAFTGSPTAPTPPDGDSSARIVTTDWAQALLRGLLTKAVTGGSVNLTTTEAGRGILVFTGALTSNSIVNLPVQTGRWVLVNRTTGAFSLTLNTLGGAGMVIAQGKQQSAYSNGTDLLPAFTEARDLSLTGIPIAPTPAPATNTAQVATAAFARMWSRGATVLTPAGGSTTTLSDVQAAVPVVRLTGTPNAAATIVFPGEPAMWTVENATAQPMTLKTAAQSGGIVLAAGRVQLVWSDATNLRAGPTEADSFSHTGIPTVPTAPDGTATTQAASTEFVKNQITGQAFYSSGDFKLTFKAAPDAGWLFLDGTSIGNAGSSATGRANADTAALFALLWASMDNTLAPVSGGRGANAAADFASNKRLTMPDLRGKALVGAGAAPGLTARLLGSVFGTETVTLDLAAMPAHDHGGATGAAGAHGHVITVTPNGEHAHGVVVDAGGFHGHAAASDQQGAHQHLSGSEALYNDHGGGNLIGNDRGYRVDSEFPAYRNQNTSAAGLHAHNISIGPGGEHGHGASSQPAGSHAHAATAAGAPDHPHAINAAGSGGAHANVQPSIGVNVMVKL